MDVCDPPNIQVEGGDCIIQLSDRSEDHLLLPSSVLKQIPQFEAVMTRWNTNGGRDVNDATSGKAVTVYTWGLQDVEVEAQGDYPIKYTYRQLLSGKYCKSGEHPDCRHVYFHISPDTPDAINPGYFRGNGRQHLQFGIGFTDEVARHGHKILFALMHNNIDISCHANVTLDCPPTWLYEAVAWAEYYFVLPDIADAMADNLMRLPSLWKRISESPVFYLMLGMKIRSAKIYEDAFRHIVGHVCFTDHYSDSYGYSGRTVWEFLKNKSEDVLFAVYTKRDELRFYTGKAATYLRKAALCRENRRSNNNRHIDFAWNAVLHRYGHNVFTRSLGDPLQNPKQQLLFLATKAVGDWLNAELNSLDACGSLLDLETFGIVREVHKAAAGNDVSIFGWNAPRRLARYFPIQDSRWTQKDAEEHLRRFMLAILHELNEDLTTLLRGILEHEARHSVSYFTHVYLEPDEYPWAGQDKWKKTITVNQWKPVSEEWAKAVGIRPVRSLAAATEASPFNGEVDDDAGEGSQKNGEEHDEKHGEKDNEKINGRHDEEHDENDDENDEVADRPSLSVPLPSRPASRTSDYFSQSPPDDTA